MIKWAYFPPLVDEATVYSLLAAASRLHGVNRPLEDITHGHARFARPLWPNHLDAVAASLPDFMEINCRDLLENHTLVPAFTPLMDQKRAQLLRESMLRGSTARVHMLAGACPTRLTQPSSLLVCPRCHQSTPHWLRFHQLPGAVMCAVHPGQVLHVTSVERSPTRFRSRHIDIRDAQIREPVWTTCQSASISQANDVAHAMRKLLSRPLAEPGPERFRLWLHDQLRARGFAAAFGKLRIEEARSAIARWLRPDFAATIGLRCPCDQPDTRWFVDMLSERHTSIFPLWAVLGSLFMERPIDQALAEAAEFTPPTRPSPKPMHKGISNAHARMEMGCKQLRRLWPQETLTVTTIARRLGISCITAIRWAAIMGLTFPRRGPTKVTMRPQLRPTLPPFAERVRQHRAGWLQAVKLLKPGQGAARDPMTQNLYAWLYRYDPAWLKRHLPAFRPARPRSLPKHDVTRVILAMIASIKAADTPTRASSTRVLQVMRQHQPGVPRSALVRAATDLNVLCEPHAEFVARRLRWLHDHGQLTQRTLTTAVKKQPALRQRPGLEPLFQRT